METNHYGGPSLYLFLGYPGTAITDQGKVIDLSDKSPLEFANITLQTADSAFITGTTTDSKGLFRIEKVKAGDYQVSVSSIGYKTSVVSVLGLSQPIDLGTISLASSSISLDEVTVNASAIRNTADRKITFPTSEQKRLPAMASIY